MQDKPPYWSVEGLFVMNGNLPDRHLRNAEKLVRVQGSRFTFFSETTVCNCSSVTFAARTSASSRIAPLSVAPLRSAPCKFAPLRLALVRSAPFTARKKSTLPRDEACLATRPIDKE